MRRLSCGSAGVHAVVDEPPRDLGELLREDGDFGSPLVSWLAAFRHQHVEDVRVELTIGVEDLDGLRQLLDEPIHDQHVEAVVILPVRSRPVASDDDLVSVDLELGVAIHGDRGALRPAFFAAFLMIGFSSFGTHSSSGPTVPRSCRPNDGIDEVVREQIAVDAEEERLLVRLQLFVGLSARALLAEAARKRLGIRRRAVVRIELEVLAQQVAGRDIQPLRCSAFFLSMSMSSRLP